MTKTDARDLLRIFLADKDEPPRIDQRAVIRAFLTMQRDNQGVRREIPPQSGRRNWE